MRRLLPHAGPFSRFALVGVANTLLDVGAFALLYRLGMFYLLAQVLSYLFGAANSYVVNRRWTFACRRGGWARQLAPFLAVNAASLGFSLLALYLLAHVLADGVGVGKLLATGAGVVVNYVGDRFWVFPAEA